MEIKIKRIRRNSSMAHNNERVATVSRFSDNTTKFETLRKQITSSDSVVMIKLTFCKN